MNANSHQEAQLRVLFFTLGSTSVVYLKFLDDAGEGQVVPAAFLQQGHAAIILRDIGVKHSKVLPMRQDHISYPLALLPVTGKSEMTYLLFSVSETLI